MRFERFDLLARVLEGHDRATYDLSSSDMPGQRLSEVGGLPDCSLAENHVGGGEELRRELARTYGGRAQDYLVTAGTSEANFAVFAALLGPGDAVLVEHPTYQPLEEIPRGLGASVTMVDRDEDEGYRLAVEHVRSGMPSAARVIVLSNLNNPTGAALEAQEAQELADLAAERDAYLVVDEIFRELAFDHESPTVGGLNDHTVVTSSVSKFYGAGGLKIGWVRAAPPVLARVRSVLEYLSGTPAGPSERIAQVLLRRREETVTRNRRLIAEGRQIAREWAEKAAIPWQEPAGHLAFPAVGKDSVRLADLLLSKYKTFIAPAESFGLHGHFRLNVGKPADTLAEGLARVSKAMQEL